MKQSKEGKNDSRGGYGFIQLTFITRKGKRKKAGRQADRQTFCSKSSKFSYMDLFRLARKITQRRDRSICFYLASVKDKPELTL